MCANLLLLVTFQHFKCEFPKWRKGMIRGLIIWACCTTIMVIADHALAAKVHVLSGNSIFYSHYERDQGL